VSTAEASELSSALELLFRDSPPDERAIRMSNTRQMLETGELNPRGIVVARNRNQIVGALICLPAAGSSGLIWSPQMSAHQHNAEIEDGLLQFATAWLKETGVKIVQALLLPKEVALGIPLLRNGFVHITRLRYLRHKLESPQARFERPANLELFPQTEVAPAVFQQTLLRSYEGTQDCPEINGVRTIEEILAGHRAQGQYDPEKWWLAQEDGTPVGVLLVVEVSEWHSWEIAYVGVVPEARARGIGTAIMLEALHRARTGKRLQLTLSVDQRNAPACHLYRKIGFTQYDAREVFLAILNR
jgi:ribosomal protein S18 acetylase RimI-like enzyme